jgi:hypothetical protein
MVTLLYGKNRVKSRGSLKQLKMAYNGLYGLIDIIYLKHAFLEIFGILWKNMW